MKHNMRYNKRKYVSEFHLS